MPIGFWGFFIINIVHIYCNISNIMFVLHNVQTLKKNIMEFKDLKFKVTWEIDDGYAGKSRPQHTIIKPSDDFTEDEWNEMDETDKKDYIDEQVNCDFEARISFYIEDYGL